MKNVEYYNILENEDTHFFYVSVHELVLKLVDQHHRPDKSSKVLDAGCGVGGLALKLRRYGEVTALDANETAIELSSRRGLNAVKGSIEQLPFEDEAFDLITCVDVIYHSDVTSDARALAELFRVLRPGGTLVMRVPARRELYSQHDVLVKTARRYSVNEVRNLLNASGFALARLSYCQSPLYIPALLKGFVERRSKEKHGHSAVGQVPPLLSSIISSVLNIENRLLLNRIDMPIGIGVIAVASKNLTSTDWHCSASLMHQTN